MNTVPQYLARTVVVPVVDAALILDPEPFLQLLSLADRAGRDESFGFGFLPHGEEEVRPEQMPADPMRGDQGFVVGNHVLNDPLPLEVAPKEEDLLIQTHVGVSLEFVSSRLRHPAMGLAGRR